MSPLTESQAGTFLAVYLVLTYFITLISIVKIYHWLTPAGHNDRVILAADAFTVVIGTSFLAAAQVMQLSLTDKNPLVMVAILIILIASVCYHGHTVPCFAPECAKE